MNIYALDISFGYIFRALVMVWRKHVTARWKLSDLLLLLLLAVGIT